MCSTKARLRQKYISLNSSHFIEKFIALLFSTAQAQKCKPLPTSRAEIKTTVKVWCFLLVSYIFIQRFLWKFNYCRLFISMGFFGFVKLTSRVVWLSLQVAVLSTSKHNEQFNVSKLYVLYCIYFLFLNWHSFISLILFHL